MVNFIRYSRLFRLYETIQPYLKYSLHLEDKLPGKKVLVLAPHQDDEVIGCGGTLYKHIKQGGTCDIVYFTHDSEERDKESLNALKILEVESYTFLQNKAESLSGNTGLSDVLSKIIEDKKPEIVFLPFLLDNHVDHRAINQAFTGLEKNMNFDFMVYAYPIWFPVYPNILVDISSQWPVKKEALECYKSQMLTRDYVKMSYSLGQYWACVKAKNLEVVETFFKASFKEYAELGNKIYK
ncbi:MAG: PIG-L family deacetylase [Elusimicrobia bacterium]|nr:PIG-L family deacetylase [Candidatus Liberimonas magnetica]